ncbi:MAG: hypothetical protein RMN52_16770 [Anaerolineae bacterium]|nr:hypothetical protein [Candidatus Roseilinea sp.]MDW8451650.1 hypothetical protein [Anaerolineae bacterium]
MPSSEDSSEIEIFFEISGGIGGIRQSWTIRGNGEVLGREGKTYTMPPTRVAQLLYKLTSAGFFDLGAVYEEYVVCADCFEYLIQVNDGRRVKRVRIVDSGQLPDQVQQVVRILRGFVSELEP